MKGAGQKGISERGEQKWLDWGSMCVLKTWVRQHIREYGHTLGKNIGLLRGKAPIGLDSAV